MGDSAGAAIVTAAMVENKGINILLHKKVNSNLLILRIIAELKPLYSHFLCI